MYLDLNEQVVFKDHKIIHGGKYKSQQVVRRGGLWEEWWEGTSQIIRDFEGPEFSYDIVSSRWPWNIFHQRLDKIMSMFWMCYDPGHSVEDELRQKKEAMNLVRRFYFFGGDTGSLF